MNQDNPKRGYQAYWTAVTVASNLTPVKNPHGDQDIDKWMKEVIALHEEFKKTGKDELIEKLPSVLRAQGWLKNCFILSMYMLLRSEDPDMEDAGQYGLYDFAMRKVIECGGDTDTNACIVGGMVGALVGFNCINPSYIGKVLSFDCTRSYDIERPEFLSPKHFAVPLIKTLL